LDGLFDPRRHWELSNSASIHPLGWLKRSHSIAILLGLLVAGVLVGCAMSPAERQAAEQAWAARDAERANRGGGGP